MESLRNQFPVLRQCLYANTATSGLLFEDLMEWRQGHDIDFLIGGSAVKFGKPSILDNTRATLSTFFHCGADEVSLTPNFTIGYNFLMEGLAKNKNILLLKTDYPSVNWPVEDRGFNVVYADINERLEENIYEALSKQNIDVFIFSIVQWVNGIIIDLAFIKKIKDEFPDVLLIADGTQFCGMYDFNFNDSGIDVLGASGYKWLLGGYGNGFFIVRKEARAHFTLKSIGNGSVEGNPSKRDDIPFYKNLEPGHLDSLNFGSLNFSLNYLDSIDMNAISQHNEKLSKRGKELFTDLGLLSEEVQQRAQHSTIFNIRAEKKIYEKLRRNEVVCVRRGAGIRLSFHFYNDVEELEKIAEYLK